MITGALDSVLERTYPSNSERACLATLSLRTLLAQCGARLEPGAAAAAQAVDANAVPRHFAIDGCVVGENERNWWALLHSPSEGE